MIFVRKSGVSGDEKFCLKKATVQAGHFNSWFSRDVTAAMLVYRTIAKKVLGI